jgi:cysteine desulfurase
MINVRREIYLDHNATTACDPEVLEAMLPFFGADYGNPASPHFMGKRASAACDVAREQVGELFNCRPSEVIFTSGATESNNAVLFGLASPTDSRRKVVTSAVEHKSILGPCDELRARGDNVVEIPVGVDGRVDSAQAAELIDTGTKLVAVQAANNEVGVLQPIQEIADLAHARGALFHCDAAQLVGKLPLPSNLSFSDYCSVSAHKIYGPKGVGALLIRSAAARHALKAVYHGGGQESGFRPGTLNVPAIVGFGQACRLIRRQLSEDVERISKLRSAFESTLKEQLPECRINVAYSPRLPGTSSITIPGVPGTMLISNLRHICIGEGSACSSGAMEPSYVLLAMGHSRDDAECTVRVSFGRKNTPQEANDAATEISDVARQLIDRLGDGVSLTAPDARRSEER